MGSIFSSFLKSSKYSKITKIHDNNDETKKTKKVVINNTSFTAAFGSGVSYCHEKVLHQLNLQAAPPKFKYCHGLKCIGEIKLTMQLENSNFIHTFAIVNESPVEFFVGDDFLKSFKSITFLSEDKTMILAKLQSSTTKC